MGENHIPKYIGNLRSHMIMVPECIQECSGISVFGKLIKSIVFTTDVAIIRNINANAVIAVYPFTPQPIITHALMLASDVPVFCGVGGGTTTGPRVIQLASDAEFQGAVGIVVNAPTANDVVRQIKKVIDIPVVVTVVSKHEDIEKRIEAGVDIFNVSAAARTPELVRDLRNKYPNISIMATGGPTDDSIRSTIEAGANAITWTPPTTAELFKSMMIRYRDELSKESEHI